MIAKEGTKPPKYPLLGDESLMSEKGHGSTARGIQKKLRFGVDRAKADYICCRNRHDAEKYCYFTETTWLREIKPIVIKGEPVRYYDSVTGKLLFRAPIGRKFTEFLKESESHGWPSFRDREVNWENVRVIAGEGETVSVDGTHLGHNLPDAKGNRYCINLVSIAGFPAEDGMLADEEIESGKKG